MGKGYGVCLIGVVSVDRLLAENYAEYSHTDTARICYSYGTFSIFSHIFEIRQLREGVLL